MRMLKKQYIKPTVTIKPLSFDGSLLAVTKLTTEDPSMNSYNQNQTGNDFDFSQEARKNEINWFE